MVSTCRWCQPNVHKVSACFQALSVSLPSEGVGHQCWHTPCLHTVCTLTLWTPSHLGCGSPCKNIHRCWVPPGRYSLFFQYANLRERLIQILLEWHPRGVKHQERVVTFYIWSDVVIKLLLVLIGLLAENAARQASRVGQGYLCPPLLAIVGQEERVWQIPGTTLLLCLWGVQSTHKLTAVGWSMTPLVDADIHSNAASPLCVCVCVCAYVCGGVCVCVKIWQHGMNTLQFGWLVAWAEWWQSSWESNWCREQNRGESCRMQSVLTALEKEPWMSHHTSSLDILLLSRLKAVVTCCGSDMSVICQYPVINVMLGFFF